MVSYKPSQVFGTNFSQKKSFKMKEMGVFFKRIYNIIFYMQRINPPALLKCQSFLPQPLQKTAPTLEKNNSDSQSFQPEYHQIKKMGLKPNKKRLHIGGWSAQQNKIYLDFMLQNVPDFLTEKQRRTTKVFFRLSKILKKRTPDQCRSHHQKLQMKHGDNILAIAHQVRYRINKTEGAPNNHELINQQNPYMSMPFLSQMPYIPFPEKKDLGPLAPTGASEDDRSRPELSIKRDWYSLSKNKNVFKIEIDCGKMEVWTP